MFINTATRRIGNDIIAAYFVVTPAGVTVIDAGLSGHYRDLVTELATVGRTIDDVKGLILTHGDSDHVGFAERLRREHGVPIYVHTADAARAKGGAKPANAKQPIKITPLLSFLFYSLRKGGMRTAWPTDVVEVHDGDTLDLPGAPRIIALPGHSAGSIGVHIPAADAVFVGDALTTRHVLTGRVGPAPAPFTDHPDQALASLRHLLSAGATWVLPGHGSPWGMGIASAITAVEAAAGTQE